MLVLARRTFAARFAAMVALVVVVVLAAVSCSSDGAQATGELQSPDAAQAANASPNSPTDDAANVADVAVASETGDIAGLTELCQRDSDLACDILYHFSDHDSDAEAIALDCGGRGPTTNSFCTTGVEADPPNVWFATDSVALGEIVGACQDGDMVACDFLFVRSPVGSTFERIGLTCGDRIAVATPDCRTAFP